MALYIKAKDLDKAVRRIVENVEGYTFESPKKTRELISNYIVRVFDNIKRVEIEDPGITFKEIAVGCGFRVGGSDYVKMQYSTWTGGLKIPDCVFEIMNDDTQVEITDVHFDVKPWDKEHWMDG